MTQLTVSRAVKAPPERVWQILTDLDRSPETISGIDSIERLAGEGFEVGTTWRETRTMFGREATEVMKVTSIDEGHSYVVEADGKGVHYRSTLSVEPAEGGSVLTMTFGGEPDGAVARFFASTVGKLFEGATRKALTQDLSDIAAAAEQT